MRGSALKPKVYIPLDQFAVANVMERQIGLASAAAIVVGEVIAVGIGRCGSRSRLARVHLGVLRERQPKVASRRRPRTAILECLQSGRMRLRFQLAGFGGDACFRPAGVISR